jgi:4-alpha-glucanotransferase
VATLPLLATFLDEPFNPSPYAPVSRLFWNELYLDATAIPELAACRESQHLLQSAEFRRELEIARESPRIDYRKVMALKRQLFENLLKSLLQSDSARRTSFEQFITRHPSTADYSAFRAKVERERQCWPHWPSRSRDGILAPADYDERARQYHLYVQWLCGEQTHTLSDKAKRLGTPLYLDFPLGVNRDGYDVWRERQLFALSSASGAPPDSLFIKGQNWGFPPLQPEALRQQGYRYYIDCLRHHLASAAMLRVDHVMGLHRAFWIPAGFDATNGMYVRYPAAEFYAIFNLESHRHQAQIIGENLGTVPDYVNQAMARRQFFGMHVGQFGVDANPVHALQPPPRQTVTSLNTHDTATFMGFWSGADIDDRLALGLINAAQSEDEHRYRTAQRDALVAFLHAQGDLAEAVVEPAAVLQAWLSFFARQDEEFLLINLEDLWLEPEPQNVPGTWEERPNWLRKIRLPLSEIRTMAPLMALLKTISDKRSRIG